jgi:type VI secretion system protein ImpH
VRADADLHALATRAAGLAFPEAVRLLAGALGAPRPVGTIGPVEDERVLFRSAPSLGFPASDIASISFAGADGPAGRASWPAQMEVNFLGLYGPSSPLSAPWTEEILTDEGDGAGNLRDLLDLFGHPLVGLAYRIWRHYRLYLQAETTRDPPVRAALALAGLISGDRWTDEALDPFRLLPFCGLLAQHGRSAAVIRRVIEGYFEVPVEVEEWLPRMAPIPPPQRFMLGAPQSALGHGTVVGESVPDVAGTVAIVLGPLSPDQFDAFLPGGAARRSLAALLRLAVRRPVECRVDLLLARDAPGGLVLGAARLGWTSWQDGEGTLRRCPTGVA